MEIVIIPIIPTQIAILVLVDKEAFSLSIWVEINMEKGVLLGKMGVSAARDISVDWIWGKNVADGNKVALLMDVMVVLDGWPGSERVDSGVADKAVVVGPDALKVAVGLPAFP